MIKNKIAIIGGGPAAIASCATLLDALKSVAVDGEIEINVYEKGSTIGIGLPYAQGEQSYILNLPVEVMGAGADHDFSYSTWASEHLAKYPSRFPPRHTFGRYLNELSARLADMAASRNVNLNYHTEHEVLDIEAQKEGGYRLTTTQGSAKASHVILCTGHMPTTIYKEFKGTPGYKHSPWELEAFANIDPAVDVAMLGSRLTAIDIAMKLKSMGHKGKIAMFSRTGLLPTVLSPEVPAYTLKYLTLANFNVLTKTGIVNLKLEDLLDLFWRELSEAEGTPIDFSVIVRRGDDLNPSEWIEKEITTAETGPKFWQQVLFAIYPIMPTIWTMLSQSDQRCFMKKYHGLLLTYLAAFPLDNAYRVKDLLKSGQLEVHGGLQQVEHIDDLFHISLASGQSYQFPVLFNATGPGYNPLNIGLYRNMHKRELLTKHHLGGIHVDPKTLKVIGKQGQPHRALFAVGELTKGACLATTDMGQVSKQADRVSTQIMQNLCKQQACFPQHAPVTSYRSPYGALFEAPRPSVSTRIATGVMGQWGQLSTRARIVAGVCGLATIAAGCAGVQTGSRKEAVTLRTTQMAP